MRDAGKESKPITKKLHKKKKHRAKKFGDEMQEVRLQSQSNFLPVDFGEGLCNDKPNEKGNIGGFIDIVQQRIWRVQILWDKDKLNRHIHIKSLTKFLKIFMR